MVQDLNWAATSNPCARCAVPSTAFPRSYQPIKPSGLAAKAVAARSNIHVRMHSSNRNSVACIRTSEASHRDGPWGGGPCLGAAALHSGVTTVNRDERGGVLGQGSGFLVPSAQGCGDKQACQGWSTLRNGDPGHGGAVRGVELFDGDPDLDLAIPKSRGYDTPVLSTESRIPAVGGRIVVTLVSPGSCPRVP